MKNYFKLLFLAILLFSISACVNYEESYSLSPEWYRIDLSNPIPGQISYYERFEGCISSFELTGDTLKLQITEKEGVLFLRESFTKNSPIRKSVSGRRIVEYPLYSVKNQLYLPERNRSKLFWFYESDYLHLKPKESISMYQQSCLVMLGNEIFTGNETGYIDRFEIGPYVLANQHVVSCEPNYLYSYLFYNHRELEMSYYLNAFGRKGFKLINADLPQNSSLERSSSN
ncbi:MAG: hypothetical protein R8P61_11100 [Bacteroidia bacterium]|nr:hypothetical protein [Bacteroidia bacterium]